MAEDALDPQLPICDPHHHLYPREVFGWPAYRVEDLTRDLALGHNVVSTVYVETSGSAYREDGPVELQPVGETEWVAQRATGRLMEAIVPYANLMLGADVDAVLEEHEKAAGGRFRGTRFRHMVLGQPEPPYDFLREPAFHAGAEQLHKRGLSLDVMVRFDLFPSLAEFARAFPDLPIVLDHLGAPLITEMRVEPPTEEEWAGRDEVLEQWRRALPEVAACENVYMKLGGIGMATMTDRSRFGSQPTSEALAAYWAAEFRFAIEAFGPARCMFQSNWPVDRELCDYATLWNVFKRVTADDSASERSDMFSGTASRVYRLGAATEDAGDASRRSDG